MNAPRLTEVTGMPSPLFSRFRRIDLRFLVGIALTAAAVFGVGSAISSLNRSVPVYVAAQPITTGQGIDSASVRVEQVNLGGSVAAYLTPSDGLDGLVAQRPLVPGELVAKSALGPSAGDAFVTTVVHVESDIPSSVSVGRFVDVWAAGSPNSSRANPVEPAEVVTHAEVTRVTQDTGLAASSGHSVEIRVPRDALSALLLAQSSGLDFTVVSSGAER